MNRIRNKEIEWHEDTEEAYVENGIDSKVYRTYYEDMHIKVYPLTLWYKRALGWEYELYSEKRGIDWGSLHETANSGILIDNIGDHANNPKQAMKWAIRTVDEWDE